MTRRDRHRLVNLSLGKKLAASAGLVLGLALFVGATGFELFVTDWSVSLGVLLDWGSALMGVAEREARLYWTLFAIHVVALGLTIGVASSLFRHVALPRGTRVALSSLVGVAGAVDLLSWVSIRHLSFAQHLLGPAVGVDALLLLAATVRLLRDMWVYRRFHPKKPVRVAVVGGGFAGLYTALGLDARLGYHEDLEIVVLDRKNYFLFPPLLPSVATGAIETRQVTYPFRRIFEATNVVFKREHVERIDTVNKVIHARVDVTAGADGQAEVVRSETPYDFLVLAPGSDTNTFGTKGVTDHAFFMRELGDAVAVRNQIIDCFERAAREPDAERRRELLTFVVVGAGPTGVELASEVRDLVAHVLLGRYPEIAASEVTVYVVQSGAQILPGWSEAVVGKASARLRELDIRVLLGRRVMGVDAFSVTLDKGEVLRARTCVWCAGVKPAALLGAVDLPKHTSGRVAIEPDLRVKGRDDVFVLGDAAYLEHRGKPLPPLGQVAFQQGAHCAKNVERLLSGQRTRPFSYFAFGSLVSVGEHFAAVELLGVKLSGFVAWLVWRALYLAKLVGFGNKVRVLLDWSLDLLVERSISQISAQRQVALAPAAAPAAAEPAPAPPAPKTPITHAAIAAS